MARVGAFWKPGDLALNHFRASLAGHTVRTRLSPLEGTGFELLVPRREARDFRSIPEQLRADDLNRSRR